MQLLRPPRDQLTSNCWKVKFIELFTLHESYYFYCTVEVIAFNILRECTVLYVLFILLSITTTTNISLAEDAFSTTPTSNHVCIHVKAYAIDFISVFLSSWLCFVFPSHGLRVNS